MHVHHRWGAGGNGEGQGEGTKHQDARTTGSQQEHDNRVVVAMTPFRCWRGGGVMLSWEFARAHQCRGAASRQSAAA
jgi:hypothetical protein